MSSFTRNIQRAAHRSYNKLGKGVGVFYEGRGSKLGVTNPGKIKAKKKAKRPPVTPAMMKARVARTYRVPTRAERQVEHDKKMAYKAKYGRR